VAGQPIKRRVFGELDRRGTWFFDEVRNGRAVTDIAEELGVGRGLVYQWVKAGGPERQAQMREARIDAAHSHVEDAGVILDTLADQDMTPPEVRLAEARAGHRRWLAEKFNREDYGQPEQTTVVQIGELYLGALRRHGGATALPAPAAALPVRDADIEALEPPQMGTIVPVSGNGNE
jgi:transposase